MALRSLTLCHGRRAHLILDTNYSTARFCYCVNHLSTILTSDDGGFAYWQQRKHTQKRCYSNFQKTFCLTSSSRYCTYSFLRFCYRKFHVATTAYTFDPVSKKVGITGFEDVDQMSAAAESASESKEAADSSNKTMENQENDDSVVFSSNELDSSRPQHSSIQTDNKDLEPISSTPLPLNTDDDEFAIIESVPLPPQQKSKLLPVHNLAALVNTSETLTELVKLGVDLAEVEKVDGAADLIVKLDFENDIRPYLLFLHDIGVPEEEMGRLLSRNPLIFEKQIGEIQERIDYLKSKRFSKEAIARIVTKSYVFLVLPVTMIDAKLGFLQKQFQLTGDEVRTVVTRLPKLIPWKTDRLKDTIFYIKEFLGFSEPEMKKMLLSQPKVFLTNKYSLCKRFDYLHDEMKMDHERVVQWPHIFRTRLHLLQQRHSFLKSLDRAQYDPDKENFVSLQALVSGKDEDFCNNLAKTSLDHYRDFLKTM